MLADSNLTCMKDYRFPVGSWLRDKKWIYPHSLGIDCTKHFNELHTLKTKLNFFHTDKIFADITIFDKVFIDYRYISILSCEFNFKIQFNYWCFIISFREMVLEIRVFQSNSDFFLLGTCCYLTSFLLLKLIYLNLWMLAWKSLTKINLSKEDLDKRWLQSGIWISYKHSQTDGQTTNPRFRQTGFYRRVPPLSALISKFN